jgi:DNA-directed RNA polymerase specialized sigma24 family protein
MPDPQPMEFETTQWSVVLLAANGTEEQRRAALEILCEDYWRAVFEYIRRTGKSPEDACDLAQEFFARLLEKHWLVGLKECGGRFRGFLATALRRFLVSEFRATNALKRGGGRKLISIDLLNLADNSVAGGSPEQAFDRRWALTVIDRAGGRLRGEAEATGRGPIFALVSGFLTDEPEMGVYESLASELGLSRGALAMTVHRFRLRWRELIRMEVAETLSDRSHVEEELRELMAALRG